MRRRDGLYHHNVDPGGGLKGAAIPISKFIASGGTVSMIVLLM